MDVALICPQSTCLELAIKNKGLERSFQGSIPSNVYEDLLKELKEIE